MRVTEVTVMSLIRCNPALVVAAVLLADVAPSCGSRPRPRFPTMQVSASDCSCAPGTIEVLVDGQPATQITCGPAGAVSLEVAPGPHTVSAQSGERRWAPQTYRAALDETTRVELGCPTPSP